MFCCVKSVDDDLSALLDCLCVSVSCFDQG